MSSPLNYSISLEQAPTWVKYKESPTTKYLESIDYEIDNSEYEEYSFTGPKSSIEARRTSELGAGGRSVQVQTTLTRLNGDVWELKVRRNKVRKKEEEEVTEEEQNAQEEKHGSQAHPRQTSINITAIQESILNHDKFKEYDQDKLGVLKMYMNGSLPGEKVQTTKGIKMLNDIVPYTNDAVKFVIKNPTYYVPSMSVTYQHWSASKDTDMSEIGTIKKPNGVTVPEGYTSLYMGSSSSPASDGKGYIIQESYTIGKFNAEPYEKK